jgi:hypothetical protein
VLALALTAACQLGAQQTGAVAGRVVDSATGEPRPGAIATIVGTRLTATANEQGRFVISRVAAGDQSLEVRAIGARTTIRRVTVRSGDTTRVDIALTRDVQVLGAVRSEAQFTERELFTTRADVGTVRVTARGMEAVPRLGEADVVRVAQLLPGVQAKNDFSTGFSVHGGESDQNLVLLDGYPVYNPFHLGGLFSTFISASVRDIQLSTGAIPAKYGDRLSSVLDVHTADESRPGIHGQSEVSVLAATTTLGSSFGDGKGSWTVAGRRTYADQLIRHVSDDRQPYHFRDEQARVTYALPHETRLAISLYDGRDVLDGSFSQVPDSANDRANGGALNASWGNLVAGATLSKLLGAPVWLGDSTVIEQRASVSRFSTLLDFGTGSAVYSNRIADSRLSGAVTTYGAQHTRAIGYDVAAYDIGYHLTSGQGSIETHDTRQRPLTAAAYVDDSWHPTPSLFVDGGARLETETGRHWSAVLPRFSVKYLTSSSAAFTASVGEHAQTLHSLAFEDSPLRLFDLWRASDSAAPVSTAWQVAAGHERWFGASRFARVEAFYKRYRRLLEYNSSEDPTIDGDEFVAADGVSYGADLLLRQFEAGPLSGWLAYTYTVSSRTHDGIRYAPGNDRRHDLNVVASWRLGRYLAGARFGYGSGLPYTEIVGELPRRIFDPLKSAWGTSGGSGWLEDIGSTRNGARLPPTHRVDLFLQRAFNLRGMSVTPYASVVNASNAKNVLFYVYDFAASPGTRQSVSQFPVLPSLGVTVAF